MVVNDHFETAVVLGREVVMEIDARPSLQLVVPIFLKAVAVSTVVSSLLPDLGVGNVRIEDKLDSAAIADDAVKDIVLDVVPA